MGREGFERIVCLIGFLNWTRNSSSWRLRVIGSELITSLMVMHFRIHFPDWTEMVSWRLGGDRSVAAH